MKKVVIVIKTVVNDESCNLTPLVIRRAIEEEHRTYGLIVDVEDITNCPKDCDNNRIGAQDICGGCYRGQCDAYSPEKREVGCEKKED